MARENNQLQPCPLIQMNLDKANRVIDWRKGEYRRALNMHFKNEGQMMLTTMDGMIEIVWNRPAGTNEPVGEWQDANLDSAFICFKNSNGNHSIVEIKNNLTAEVIFQSSALEFTLDMGGGALIYEKSIVAAGPGHEIKMLDYLRRIDAAKLVKLTVFLPTSPDVVDQRTFAGTVLLNGVVQATSAGFYTAAPGEVFSFTEMVRLFAAGFQAAFPTQFTATGCGSWVELEALAVGDWTINLTYTDIIDTVVQPSAPILWERLNTYMTPMNRWQVNLAKFSPVLPPIVTAVYNPRKVGSNIDGSCYQFDHRYRFRDGSYSAEGPFTTVTPVSAQVCGLSSTPNALEVFFGNDIPVLNAQALAEITSVDIFVKIGTNLWKLARTLEKWEFIYTKSWLFQNDNLLQPFQDALGPFPIQPQTYVPLRANSIAVATEPNDQATTRLVAAGIHEGFPSPCVNVDLQPVYSNIDPDQGSFCTVKILMRVIDLSQDDGYALAQPIGKYGTEIVYGGLGANAFTDTVSAKQVMKSGGFIAYVAGTDFYGISNQIITPPTLGCSGFNPTILPSSRGALDLTSAGSSGFVCNRTHRAAARLIIENFGDIFQEVLLQVPSGRKLLIRFADHQCSASGLGDIYDLSQPGRAWHATSGCVIGTFGGQAGTTHRPFEIEVDIPAGYTGTWNAGWAYYQSLSGVTQFPNIGIPYRGIRAYTIDANNVDYSPSTDIRVIGTRAEKQVYTVEYFDGFGTLAFPYYPNGNQIAFIDSQCPLVGEVLQGRTVTDHNGHAFFSVGFQELVPGMNWRGAWFSITGDPLNPSDTVPAWMNGGLFGPTFLTIPNDGNQNKWVGNLSTLTALTGPDTGPLTWTGDIAEHIVPNLVPGAREKIRTWLDGTVEDANGNPLPGLSVVIQHGGTGSTGALGTFTIPIYGDMFVGQVVGANNNDRTEDGIYVLSTGLCMVDLPPDAGYFGPFNISQFEALAPYSDTIHFPVGLIVGSVLSSSASVAAWPRGWKGRFGLKLYDAHGRQTPVQPIGKEVRLAWRSEDLNAVDPITYPIGTVMLGTVQVNFTINGPVPTPQFGNFISYQFCATVSTMYSRRLDWVVPSASYATEYVEGTGFTFTAYSSGSSRILCLFMDDGFLRFREINQQTALTDAALNLIDVSGPGWEWQKGDRIIFETKSDGTSVFYDLELTGYRAGALTMDASGLPFEVVGGERVTLYRPALNVPTEDGIIFYEIPLAAYRINDPFGLPTWSVASGTLDGGDHWILPTAIPIRPGNTPPPATPDVPWSSVSITRYSQSASDFFPSQVPSMGRAWASIPDAATDYRRSMFRWSQPWYNGSGLAAVTANGIPTFYDIDFKEGGSDLGAIISVRFIEDRLLFFGSGGATLSGYIGFVTSQAQGQEIVASSSGFISQTREQAVKRGTSSPLSVQRWDTWMFAFDYANASFYAASVNGLDPKEVYGIQQWLRNEMDKFTGYPQPRVCIGVDDKRDEIWLTVEPRTIIENGVEIEIGNFTLVFEAKNNRFVTFFGAAPRIYTRHKTRLFSVLGGRIWQHDADPNRPGGFYGTGQVSHVEVVVNNPVECAWATFSSFGMKGTAEFNDADGEPNRTPAGRISFSPVMKVTSSGINADRGIPPDPGFGKLRSYALSTILTGAAGLKHRILGYLIRGIKTP